MDTDYRQLEPCTHFASFNDGDGSRYSIAYCTVDAMVLSTLLLLLAAPFAAMADKDTDFCK